ncbi:hypothetical protein [Methylotenera mobilis]|jgi:hypothetical protein|uniref:hypothetical protein n=1 Tax=Methylotenera mobilis TaxID=359408 RepID=UPI000366CA93|nr:hypothetical protein [Methylotenera mobilis]
MPFKLSGYSLLLITALIYTAPALAESSPPLDFIEMLGEMDDDGMLEAALAELAQKQTNPQKTNTVKQSNKQHADMAAPAGGSKK